VGKHRKHPGGRGNAGGQHHHRILFDKYHPRYFGKVGMRHFHKTKQNTQISSINIDKINSILLEKKHFFKNENGKIPIIDMTHLGFLKVLGKGKIPLFPMIIKAKNFSKNAEKKISKSGGKCILIP
jgi:large subunit ribosomal protein L27Ae